MKGSKRTALVIGVSLGVVAGLAAAQSRNRLKEPAPLVIQSQGMADAVNLPVQGARRQFEGPKPSADAPRHLIDRQTVRRDRVPNPEQLDRRGDEIVRFCVRLSASNPIEQRNETVTECPE